jgi:hypothetical protein
MDAVLEMAEFEVSEAFEGPDDFGGRYLEAGPRRARLLTAAAARTMPDWALEEAFQSIVYEVLACCDRHHLPPDFPVTPSAMTRTRILEAIDRFAYWFDPEGGHVMPAWPTECAPLPMTEWAKLK